jgi:type 1 glutamine amidotransferase
MSCTGRQVINEPTGLLVATFCLAAVVLFVFFGPLPAAAQHEWQRPLPPRSKAQIERIIGPVVKQEPTRDLKIVWVWSKHDHGPGFHEYEKVRDLFASLLSKVPRVQVEPVYKFPAAAQWQSADLVVFYLHLDRLQAEHYELMLRYLRRGGGIVAIHEAMIMRPHGGRLAECFGLAWDEGASLWGVMPTPFQIVDEHHPIFAGFGREMDLVDEFYWRLTGTHQGIHVLATSQAGPPHGSDRAPVAEELDGENWPLFWTKELDRGRVFASLPGHNLFTFDDPYFRAILLRAMAWTTRQSFDPFKPLVTDGIALTD